MRIASRWSLLGAALAVLLPGGVAYALVLRGLRDLPEFFVLGILALLWAISFREEHDLQRRLILFAPVSVMLFSLNYAATPGGAMTGLHDLPVIFFSLAAICALGRGGAADRHPRRWFVGACAAAGLACLASANGFLLAPIGVAVFWSRGQRGRAAMWSAVFVLAAAGSLYQVHAAVPAFLGAISSKPLFFLTVLGGAAPAPLMVPLGAFSLVLLVWAVRARYARENLPAVLMAAWIVLSAAAMALGSGELGLAAAHASRLRIYSDLMVIFCFLSIAEWLCRMRGVVPRRMYKVALAVVVLYYVQADISAWRLLSGRDSGARVGQGQAVPGDEVAGAAPARGD
jgi:hypothetical protein